MKKNFFKYMAVGAAALTIGGNSAIADSITAGIKGNGGIAIGSLKVTDSADKVLEDYKEEMPFNWSGGAVFGMDFGDDSFAGGFEIYAGFGKLSGSAKKDDNNKIELSNMGIVGSLLGTISFLGSEMGVAKFKLGPSMMFGFMPGADGKFAGVAMTDDMKKEFAKSIKPFVLGATAEIGYSILHMIEVSVGYTMNFMGGFEANEKAKAELAKIGAQKIKFQEMNHMINGNILINIMPMIS